MQTYSYTFNKNGYEIKGNCIDHVDHVDAKLMKCLKIIHCFFLRFRDLELIARNEHFVLLLDLLSSVLSFLVNIITCNICETLPLVNGKPIMLFT